MGETVLPQNILISELSKINQAYPRIEKVLIVPDYQTGHQILEYVVRSGVSWINFTIATPTSLAIDLVEDEIISNNLELLSADINLIVVDTIFNSLSSSQVLTYFEKHPVNKGMIEALVRSISDLRICGISSKNIQQHSFVSPKKANDLTLLLAEYEKVLKKQKFIDTAELLSMALGRVSAVTDKEKKFVVPHRFYLRGVVRMFVEKIAAENLIVVAEDSSIGLAVPSDAWPVKEKTENLKANSDSQRLKWLFDHDNPPKAFHDSSIEIFSAVGERNEIREVFRRIAREKIKVDETELIYTDSGKYLDLIYFLCEKLGIPVTFSNGISFNITRAGRALMNFLFWIKEDFREIHLRRILDSGTLKIKSEDEDNSESVFALGHLLRISGVGWGRERHSQILSQKIEESKKYRHEADDDELKGGNYYTRERKIKSYERLLNICTSLLTLIPNNDEEGKINFSKLCAGLLEFLNKYVKILDEYDAFFVARAKEIFSQLGTYLQEDMAFEEALGKLITIISNIRIKPSVPKPGCLHVAHYKSGARSGRTHTFIVGLDEGKFPERVMQDPVLLDEERKNLHSELELSQEKLHKNVYEMAALIASLRGKVRFSYSTYDAREERKTFPSSLLLQVFRIKEGNPNADYNEMQLALSQPVAFSGTGVNLDQTDWWLNKLVDGVSLKDGMGIVKEYFPGLKEGLFAAERRASDDFSEYDGKVTVKGSDVDPRENKNLVMSCSMIEMIARCPFAYFLKHLLLIYKPEEVEKDMTLWLSPAQRGTLLHEVFKLYAEQMCKESKSIGFDKQKKVVLDILDKTVQEFKEEIPPPSDVVFQSEFTQLKRDAEVFLKINERLETSPVMWEVSFGDNDETRASISLGDGTKISLRGRIDRIDKARESEYHVWDYKTGSSFGFDEKHYINGGTQIQHILYAEAAVKILQSVDKNAKVTRSGYILPTERGTKDGKGGILQKDVALKVKGQEALRIIFDIVKSGTFMRNVKNEGCNLCDYSEICDGESSQNQIKQKLGNEKNTKLQLWIRLKEYE